jgi:hypothetical protein
MRYDQLVRDDRIHASLYAAEPLPNLTFLI